MPHVHVLSYDETSGISRAEYDAAIARAGRIWNIVSIQGQLPEVMRDSLRLYGSIMFGPSPLTRAQREMLAVITSSGVGMAGRASGVVTFGFYIGFVASPMLFGLLVDRSAGYTLAWLLVAATFAVTALVIAAWRRSEPRAD